MTVSKYDLDSIDVATLEFYKGNCEIALEHMRQMVREINMEVLDKTDEVDEAKWDDETKGLVNAANSFSLLYNMAMAHYASIEVVYNHRKGDANDGVRLEHGGPDAGSGNEPDVPDAGPELGGSAAAGGNDAGAAGDVDGDRSQ